MDHIGTSELLRCVDAPDPASPDAVPYGPHKPVFMLLFGSITFSAGINVTPLPQEDTHGILATPGLPERIFAAVERGSKVSTDSRTAGTTGRGSSAPSTRSARS